MPLGKKKLPEVGMRVRVMLGLVGFVLRGWEEVMARAEIGVRMKPKGGEEVAWVLSHALKELEAVFREDLEGVSDDTLKEVNDWMGEELPFTFLKADQLKQAYE